MSLADEIRAVMSERGITPYAISRDAGVCQALMSKFFSGKGNMSVKTISAMLDYLGYELTIRKKRKSQSG